MDCRKIQELLAAYLEGTLKPDEGLMVREHLSSCEKCRCAAEDLKKTGGLLKNLEEIEPPPWLTRKIMARVRDVGERKSGVWKWLFHPLHVKLPMQGIAAVLMVGLAAFLYKAMAPQYQAARISAPSPLPREETVARSLSDSRESAKEAQPLYEGASKDAARQFSAREQRTLDEPLLARKAPAPSAPGMQQSPEPPESSSPAYAPSAVPDKSLAPSPQEDFALSYPKAKALAPRSAGAPEVRSRSIELTVRVADIADAATRIEKILGDEGAHRVTKDSQGGKDSISAEILGEKVNGLLLKLNTVGATRGTAPAIEAGETVAVRIDLQDRSAADEGVR